jgi:hypothetical protein
MKYLSNKEIAPATTGDATLVPDNERQPPLPKIKQPNRFKNALSRFSTGFPQVFHRFSTSDFFRANRHFRQ